MIEVEEHDGGRSVGKVTWRTTMSLDGFIADPHDSIAAFLEKSTEPSALANEVIQTTGVFMIGGRPGARRTDLEGVSVEPVGQITEFRFRVLK